MGHMWKECRSRLRGDGQRNLRDNNQGQKNSFYGRNVKPTYGHGQVGQNNVQTEPTDADEKFPFNLSANMVQAITIS